MREQEPRWKAISERDAARQPSLGDRRSPGIVGRLDVWLSNHWFALLAAGLLFLEAWCLNPRR